MAACIHLASTSVSSNFMICLQCTSIIPYSRKFSLDKNFAKPRYLCIAEIFDGINFHKYGKGRHMLYVIINTGQKIRGIKLSPTSQVAKLVKIFWLYGT